ncbi:Stk1 family PASTA domain-containing Ser/Thr kinase [Actinoallomurus bryophytorum]|uniref:non-specific serine/threonine protein kinase n=1 Tax=Actinoallomurus bryophytorum TaxID=1490222 RepID=A0A543CC81_9ACTN|nr:Stk1 family PASTA domain-containing Ser/Thr kinase [Actinoallomurus bryophytorum]TQL94679.1 serine/threonine-protein kinase [Actinoallomurus bryophytorum]
MDTTVADPLVGQVLDGRYRVQARIAQGGMATVYVGHDTKLERTVALKVMHANLVGDAEFVRRFIAEAKHAAALSHPSVVAVYDQGTDKGYVFLAMEYVPGRTLRALLTERGRLGPRQALEIMQPVLAALAAAHRAGMVHRDVKPENVLLNADGRIKVADFGLARTESASKQTKTGMLIGTVGYLAPEQVLSGDADSRSDVYSAGIMLFELLTGRQPHQGGTPLSVAYKHVNEVVPLPSSVIPGLPPQIDALVASATNRDPARRPSDAVHFHTAAGEVYRTLPRDIDETLADVTPVTATNPTTPALAAASTPDSATHTFNAGSGTQMLGPHTMAIGHGDHPSPPPPPAGLKDRLLRPPGLYGVIAAAVVVILLLGGLVYTVTVGNTEHVPKLVGLSEEDARVQAAKVGLKVKRGDSRYDDNVPKDKVAEVQPKVGTEVKKGSLLTLVFSKGKKPVDVPDVHGIPLDQAKQRLKSAGLQAGDEVQQESTTVPRGYVIKTKPAAGQTQSPDEPVTLVVSSGIKMPNLVNMRRDQANAALTKLGLNVQWQEQDPAPNQPENTVIAQNPPPGQQVNSGSPVQLTVTKGQCQWWNPFCKDNDGGQGAVPQVVGQPIPQARQLLRQNGFQVNVSGGHGRDIVTGQNPPPGTPQPHGATITIWH